MSSTSHPAMLRPNSRVRRSAYSFFHINDGSFLDLRSMLEGRVRTKRISQVCAISIVKGTETIISIKDLRLLFEVPSDRWIRVSKLLCAPGASLSRIISLTKAGLLISDESGAELSQMLRRDEVLLNEGWNIYAALYHFMTRWENVSLGLSAPSKQHAGEQVDEIESDKLITSLTRRYGDPPPHFYSPASILSAYELPLVRRNGQLYDILMERMTKRAFDSDTPMTLQQLGVILYYVYGCNGYAPIAKQFIGLKKTSPSGGGLHPTEVYPLVMNVEHLHPGVYHYNVRDHSLELLRRVSRGKALKMADEFTAGQGFPMDAAALFVMTTRFYRNYWKYRMHRKAYSVLLMDAAHLSQTFYLVCAELGLGAFVTAAINHVNIERALNLDGFREGAIAICGSGVRALRQNEIDPEFIPYLPRQTRC